MIISMHQKDKAILVGNQTGVITSTAMIVRYIRTFSVEQRSANRLVGNESSRI